ncbi:MAG TPA: hypothetical protein VGH20_01895 [Myxococcales bacterium]|jgi:hypothetical protein
MARKTETPVAPKTPLGQARAALQAGNVRLAHKLAAEAAATGPAAEREEARQLVRSLSPDPQPLLVVAAVLILIIIAAWLAILRHH